MSFFMQILEHFPVVSDLVENIEDGMYYVDRERRIRYWNHAAQTITGFSPAEVVGSRCQDKILQHVDENGADLCGGLCPLAMTLVDGAHRSVKVYLRHKDGHRLPVYVKIFPCYSDGSMVGALELFSEAPGREELAQRLREMERSSFIDFLTGVPNRAFGEKKLEGSFSDMRRFAWPFGLVLLDVDNFKTVNDRHGHKVGDDALKMVSGTLMAAIRPSDLVARWGGEEFMVLLVNVDAESLKASAERLRALVAASECALPDGQRLRVTASLGATLCKLDDDPQGILERADGCMYKSKLAGKNRVTVG